MIIILEPIVGGQVTQGNYDRVLSWTTSDLASAVRKSLARRVGVPVGDVKYKVQPKPRKKEQK